MIRHVLCFLLVLGFIVLDETSKTTLVFKEHDGGSVEYNNVNKVYREGQLFEIYSSDSLVAMLNINNFSLIKISKE